MSANSVLWNADEWLKNNYEENNGLPRFFVAGDYSYQNRDRAMNDYVTIVTLATSLDDPLYSQWATAVSEAKFSILANRSVEEFWIGLLEYENRQRKYYKDLLKAVISSKIHLNELVENFPGMTQEKVKNLQMPLCVASSTTCYVYGLYLESRSLYILEDVCSMSILSSLKEIRGWNFQAAEIFIYT